MMRVLHYIPSIDEASGGVGAYMQLIAKGLNELVELHVATVASPRPRKVDCAGLHTVSSWKNPLKLKKEWLKLLERLKPDVVHVNCCWNPSCAWVEKWAQQKGYKVVLTPHGMLEPWIVRRHYWTRKLPAIMLYQRAAVRNADFIHATAESERHNLLRLGWNSRIKVIGNCVDVNEIEMKQSWARKKRMLFLSRVHVKKGINYLIEACAELKEILKDWEVIIAGAGEEVYVNELKTMAEKRGVGGMVKFVGPVFGNAKYELYRKADLFVLPTHSENFGIVVTEALAAGTPVITTVGAPWEELRTRHCGWWIEIGTKPLVAALREFLACSETEIKTMGGNGRRLVEEKYDTKIIARQFVEMYHQPFRKDT